MRTKQAGAHEVRIAFPPGPRRTGSGRLLEILHPADENPCPVRRANLEELIIFGNPDQGDEQELRIQTPAGEVRVKTHKTGSFTMPDGKVVEVWEETPESQRARGVSEANPGMYDAIHAGSRVTIVDRFGQQRTGRAVMRGPAGWVLNMGGPHGTPAIAHPDNVTRVKNPIEELVIFGNPARSMTPEQHRKAVQKMLARMPKQIRGVFDRNPEKGDPGKTKQAIRLFESFHGREPEEIVEAQRSAAMRMDYTALGDLVAIGLGEPELHGQKLVTGWERLPHLAFDGDEIKLASSPNGKQLYVIGGCQDLDDVLADTDVDLSKDLADLGEAGFIVYEARKAHTNFEPIEWVHELGEDTGVRPRLVYDRIRKELFFAGGEYFIDTSKGLSPGIEN